MKNDKGMTLASLSATIIVLIILAGVSFAMLTGDNGLFINKEKAEKNKEITNAKESIDSALEAIRNEATIKISENASIIDYYTRIDLSKYGIDTNKSYTLVTVDGNETTGITNDGVITIKYENKEKNISLTGKIDFKIETIENDTGSLYGTIEKAH